MDPDPQHCRKLYQTRGLRQGCNLSAILFVIYASELGKRLEELKIGAKLPSGRIVGFLMFADDVVLIATTEEDLETFLKTMQKWCEDFKMKISVKLMTR